MCETAARCTKKGFDSQMHAATAEVLDHYELGEVVSLSRLRSRTNENYLLTTPERRYVLRSSHRSRSLSSLAFEHRLLCYLARQGFPVVVPLPSREMKTWVSFNSRFWTLCLYADGEQLDRTRPSQLTEAARALAMYHRFARGFERSDVQRAGTLNVENWLRTTAEASVRLGPATQPEVEEARIDLVASLDRLGRDLASPNIVRLLKVVIHGDFSRRNILFQQDQLLAVLDFDGCHFEIRAMDLAVALKNMCRGLDKHSQLDMERVSAFMAAYQAEESLTDDELAAIPILLQAQRLRSLVARYERLCFAQSRKEHRTKKFLSELARLRWLEDHHNEIVDALYGRRGHFYTS
jgi:Ser/Thr protein kinase RdoA (MazF antagonist)